MKSTNSQFIFLFIFFIIVYSLGSFSKIPFGDCVGYVLTTEKGIFIKEATATSHILYINAAILIKKLLFIDGILANKILVITSGAAVVSLIYLIVFEMTKKQLISFISAVVFGFSFSFWRNAEIVEVYTFNAVWITLYYYFALKAYNKNSPKHLFISSIFLGISLWAHIQNILLIPSYLLLLFYFKKKTNAYLFPLLAFFILFGLLFVVNISQSLSFHSVFTSEQGNWVSNSFKKDLSTYFNDFIKSLGYLIYNFNLFVIIGIYGFYQLFTTQPRIVWFILTASLAVYGFSTFYAVSDNYVFFIPFNILFAILIGVGLSKIQNKIMLKSLSFIAFLIPLFYIFSFSIAQHTEKGKNFGDFKSYKGGLTYYLLPWMNENVGIVEFTLENRKAPEKVNWMTYSALEYINLLKTKNIPEDEIKKH